MVSTSKGISDSRVSVRRSRISALGLVPRSDNKENAALVVPARRTSAY